MFPDSEVVQKFSMGKAKSRYMIIYGLASYFKKELLKKKLNSFLFYSVSFDESLILGSKNVKRILMFIIGAQRRILLLHANLIQRF